MAIRRPVAAVAAVVAAGAAVVAVALRHHSAVTPQCTATDAAGTVHLDPAQAQNAAIIAAVGHRLGLPDHAVTVALATALQESVLRDLPSGDRDSVGLFQQRPSQGWGARTQLLDPAYAAAAFYQRLETVPGWQTLPVTEAAQAVQLSAAPDAYAAHEADGRTLAVALTGEAPAALVCRADAYAGAAPPAGALAAAATSQFGTPVLGVPTTAPTGWIAAEWSVAHAIAYHVSSVSFDGRTWTLRSGAWRSAGPATDVVAVTAAP